MSAADGGDGATGSSSAAGGSSDPSPLSIQEQREAAVREQVLGFCQANPQLDQELYCCTLLFGWQHVTPGLAPCKACAWQTPQA